MTITSLQITYMGVASRKEDSIHRLYWLHVYGDAGMDVAVSWASLAWASGSCWEKGREASAKCGKA